MIGIIGAGPAGLYAAYSCNNKNLPYIVFSCDSKIGGQCITYYANKNINNLPGITSISSHEFIKNLTDKCKFNEKNLILNAYATIRKKEQFIVSAGGSEYAFKYIILATGIGRLNPIVPQNIANFKTLQSKKFIQIYCSDITLYSNKIVCIAGGGDSAVDYALLISKTAKQVILVHRRDKLTCQFEKIQLLTDRRNVHVKLNCKIINLELNRVFINNENPFYTDYIIFCYGFLPDNTHLNQLPLETQNDKVFVSIPSMETSIKQCYAIGDTAIYANKIRNILSCCWEAEQAVNSIWQEENVYK